MNQIQDDIDQFFEVTDCLSVLPKTDPPDLMLDSDGGVKTEVATETATSALKKKSLMNLILSFLVYRPDVGYVKVSTNEINSSNSS